MAASRERARRPGGKRADGAGAPALPPAFAADLADFLEALRVEAGLAPATLRAYRGDLARFLGFAARRGAQRFAAIDADLVVDHLADLRAAGRAEASVARALSAVRMLARHLV